MYMYSNTGSLLCTYMYSNTGSLLCTCTVIQGHSCVCVQFVIIGGSENRMKSFAAYLAARMGLSEEEKDKSDVSRTDRFKVFKVGPVLAMSVSLH